MNQAIIDIHNGLSFVLCQAINEINDNFLLAGQQRTIFSEIFKQLAMIMLQNFWWPTSRHYIRLYSLSHTLITLVPAHQGVGGAVRFLVVGTIGQEERPPRGQLWMEQCLTSLKYWPI